MVQRRQSWLIEAGAAGLLACACAFATAVVLLSGEAGLALAAAAALGAGLLAFAAAFAGLMRIAAEQDLMLAQFELAPVPDPLEALLLTEGIRLEPQSAEDGPNELVLDDVLAELRPSARVIQLFDPSAMPTAGELQLRIDRHLNGSASTLAPPDASEALHQALADLRRSLR